MFCLCHLDLPILRFHQDNAVEIGDIVNCNFSSSFPFFFLIFFVLAFLLIYFSLQHTILLKPLGAYEFLF